MEAHRQGKQKRLFYQKAALSLAILLGFTNFTLLYLFPKQNIHTMIKILANDGIHPDGKMLLEEANYQVDTDHVPQDQLPSILPQYDGIIVRSATKVRKDLIDQCPNLKVIARAGVGMDNIDVDYAQSKGIKVINTPNASSQAVAELVIGQLFVLSRFLHQSNRQMPTVGLSQFKQLKEEYSEGFQVRGKTLGIIGFGRIGQALAKAALGLGLRVIASDVQDKEVDIHVDTPHSTSVSLAIKIKTCSFDKVLKESDFISVHVPFSGGKAPIGSEEIAKMKDGVILINTSRGGVIDESALLQALETGKVAGAALDVFENEPKPRLDLLQHPRISLTPHIGASTFEAQRYIGLELADAFIEFFGS
jgi:D-3-phosphoglycerate dehydrogenase